MATTAPATAPWRSLFLSHVNEMETPEFVLSTLHPVAQSVASPSRPQHVPRARTVVFRGMWAGLPVNPKNEAELNPSVYESDLPTITSDARMGKVAELLQTTSTGGPGQSGCGGPVEAVFWAAKPRTQWRLRGHAYVMGPDIDEAAGAGVRSALGSCMRKTAAVSPSTWSWSRELTAHFGNLSPAMRGAFRNPPPGTPVSIEPSEGLGLGQKVEDLHDAIARRNFRVLVIVPDDVDRVDLTDPDRARRWNYKRDGPGWTEMELWP